VCEVCVGVAADLWQRRRDVFEHSYREVLDALEYQDQRVARILTAISFLTAAGVALYSGVAKDQPPIRFSEWRADLPTVFFATFLVFVVLAVVFTLAAGAATRPLRLPLRRSPEIKPDDQEDGEPSLLYYASISSNKEWSEYKTRTADRLERQLATNFHDEAQLLAKRVIYKLGRSGESTLFVQLAVLSLSLLGIFSISRVSLSARWWIAAGLLLSLLAMPIWELLQMRAVGWRSSTGSYFALSVILGATGFLMGFGPWLETRWWAIAYGCGSVAATRLALARVESARVVLPLAALVGPVLVAVELLTPH
jgi:hypothetical protein